VEPTIVGAEGSTRHTSGSDAEDGAAAAEGGPRGRCRLEGVPPVCTDGSGQVGAEEEAAAESASGSVPGLADDAGIITCG